jgi:hypothetical protein
VHEAQAVGAAHPRAVYQVHSRAALVDGGDLPTQADGPKINDKYNLK